MIKLLLYYWGRGNLKGGRFFFTMKTIVLSSSYYWEKNQKNKYEWKKNFRFWYCPRPIPNVKTFLCGGRKTNAPKEEEKITPIIRGKETSPKQWVYALLQYFCAKILPKIFFWRNKEKKKQKKKTKTHQQRPPRKERKINPFPGRDVLFPESKKKKMVF